MQPLELYPANTGRQCDRTAAATLNVTPREKWSRPLGISVATMTLALTLAGCHGEHHGPPAAEPLPTATVKTFEVHSEQHRGGEEVVGTVRAKLRAVLEAKVSGRITKMPVTLGQKVKAGQLLARLDAAEIAAKLSQARALREQAQADLKRFSALLAQQAVTRQEYDAAQTRLRVAEAGVQEAATLVGYTTVKAPFAGVVTHKMADVGDLATPGKPLLEIEDPRDLRLEIDVPEALIGNLSVGTSLSLRLSSVDHEIKGTVTEIAPSADPNSRTSLVKVDLPANLAVRVGQFGRAMVPTSAATILSVPKSAVVVRGQMEIVFAVDGGKALLRLVKTGKRFGDQVEILAGVHPGDTLVIDGAEHLVDDQPVEVKP